MGDNDLTLRQDQSLAVKERNSLVSRGLALSDRLSREFDITEDPAIRRLRRDARRGDADAQLELGKLYAGDYDDIDDFDGDDEEALKWLLKAAEQNLAEAQCRLALLFHDGKYGENYEYIREPDSRMAIKWALRAAEQGYALAQALLAKIYFDAEYSLSENGNELILVRPADDTEAIRWARAGAEQGNSSAYMQLGFAYENGRGVPKDLMEAYRWHNLRASTCDKSLLRLILSNPTTYRDRVASQLTSEQVIKAQQLSKEWWKDHHSLSAEFRKLQKFAEQGDANGQFQVGKGYHLGQNVPQDYTEAHEWLVKAAQQGHSEAQGYLGEMYHYGYGVVKNELDATNWYIKAAEQENHRAIYMLVLLRERNASKVTPEDWLSSSERLRKARLVFEKSIEL